MFLYSSRKLQNTPSGLSWRVFPFFFFESCNSNLFMLFIYIFCMSHRGVNLTSRVTTMGFTKGYFWLVGWLVNCSYLLEDSEFHIWLLFFFLTHSLVVFFLAVKAVKELRIEGKRWGYFLTQTLFWVLRLFCGRGTFFWIRRNSRISPRQGVEVYHRIIFGNYKFKGPSCVQWVCLTEAATSRRDTTCY